MSKINAPAAPNLPLAPEAYNRPYADQLNNTLRLYFNQMSNVLNLVVGNEGGQYLSFPYGAFQDNTTQTAAATSTAYAVIWGETDTSNSVVVATDGTNLTRVTVDETGLYNFAFSLQLVKASANSKNAWIWPRINGVDVPKSATKVTLAGSSAAAVAAWNFFVSVNDGDYLELYWMPSGSGVQLLSELEQLSPPHPVKYLLIQRETRAWPQRGAEMF